MIQTTAEQMAVKPLSGVRILDLTQAYSGPFATMHLADQGATVIKIERPGVGDQTRNWGPFKNGASGYYAYINRNKYGMTLDLKSEEGQTIFKELVKKADVVCENFRVGTMEKMGLGYEDLKKINPQLIYASISGFGLTGPLAKQPCYDVIAQAMGGMMSMTGTPGHMVKVGPAIADNYSGTYLALAIVMALYQKEHSGVGRRLDVSMVDTIFSILETGAITYTLTGVVSQPVGNRDPEIAPFDVLKAKDGAFAIACGTEKFWRLLCDVMKMPELMTDPWFADNEARCAHYDALKPILEKWSCQYTVDELEKMIQPAGIPFGRINNTKEACESDLIRRRHMLWQVDDPSIGETISIPGTPLKMHGCEDKVARPAPLLGQHTDDVLKDWLHLDPAQIQGLHDQKVI